MTARPDVPDTPDRTDAIARIVCPSEMHPEMPHDPHRAIACSWADTLVRLVLATDDPAAVAALAATLAATLAERHPDALLTALTNAGVLLDVGTSEDAQYMSGLRPREATS